MAGPRQVDLLGGVSWYLLAESGHRKPHGLLVEISINNLNIGAFDWGLAKRGRKQ